MVIPETWMQPCVMKRVITHWTAGTHSASSLDKEHYHIIVEGDGNLVKGDHDIADNVSTSDDDYAAHTRRCNTGSIGISLACMGGNEVKEDPFNAGPWPMTETQWDKMVEAVADLVTFYGISITPETVLSHAEVQGTLNIPQRGKWDFTRLAFDPSVSGAKACGDKLRADVETMLDVRSGTAATVSIRPTQKTKKPVPA